MESVLQKMHETMFSSTSEERQKVYDTWFKNYDDDAVVIGFAPPIQVAKMFEKYSKNCDIALDIGAGTGAIVKVAREAGYQKEFDVLDANLSMLVELEKKQLNVRNIIRHEVQDDGILPLKEESYDIVTCAGSFAPNHVPPTAIKGIFNVIKPGGLAIIQTRSNTLPSFKMKYDEKIEELLAAKKIEVIEKHEFIHCVNVGDTLAPSKQKREEASKNQEMAGKGKSEKSNVTPGEKDEEQIDRSIVNVYKRL